MRAAVLDVGRDAGLSVVNGVPRVGEDGEWEGVGDGDDDEDGGGRRQQEYTLVTRGGVVVVGSDAELSVVGGVPRVGEDGEREVVGDGSDDEGG